MSDSQRGTALQAAWKQRLAKEALEYAVLERCRMLYSGWLDDLRELGDLHQTIETFIKRSEAEAIQLVVDSAAASGQEIDWANEHPYHWEDEIGQHFRKSLVVSLVAALEHHLSHYCKKTSMIVRGHLPPDNLEKALPKGVLSGRASFLETVRAYLVHVGGFERPTDEMWDHLGQVYALRNLIVHRGAVPEAARETDSEKIRRLAAWATGIEVMPGGIDLRSQFGSDVHRLIADALADVQKEVEALCDRRGEELGLG